MLAQNLVSKLLLSFNIFTEPKIASYYDNNAVPKDLNFQHLETSPEKILSILKAGGIDNLSGEFLKDGTFFSTTNNSSFHSFY